MAELCHSSSASLVQNDADCYVSSVVCFCCSAFAAIATQHCVGDKARLQLCAGYQTGGTSTAQVSQVRRGKKLTTVNCPLSTVAVGYTCLSFVTNGVCRRKSRGAQATGDFVGEEGKQRRNKNSKVIMGNCCGSGLIHFQDQDYNALRKKYQGSGEKFVDDKFRSPRMPRGREDLVWLRPHEICERLRGKERQLYGTPIMGDKKMNK